jgi:hypothetical protein
MVIDKFLIFIAANVLISCSAPKYYYFEKYAITNPRATKKENKVVAEDLRVQNIGDQNSSTSSWKEVAPSESKKREARTRNKILSISQENKSKCGVRNKGFEVTATIREKRDRKKNGLAIAGFVCSVLGCFILGFSIFGIVFSALGLKSERRKLAKTGLIIGVVATTVAAFIIGIIFLFDGGW